ncbi:MAG TPA: Uma2 family endonuclease [Thermoanaerobaculia bacterium]|jgi:Uma2 family endonuclease|nr:Uma2 family endonuclease [Thermoanaerobaculia bacterium]
MELTFERSAYYLRMSSPNVDFVTPGEYLELERKSETRNEYIAGRMFARSVSNHRHNLIVGNLLGLLSSQMRGRACEAFAVAMRVKVSATGMYAYPDIVAVCGEPRLEDEHFDTLLNPQVIVEVLSELTEAYDRGEKFAHYHRLDTLREYVLVAQDKVRVEHYVREGEQWILSEISDPEGTLHLASVDCHVGLAAIYEKVEFNPLPKVQTDENDDQS